MTLHLGKKNSRASLKHILLVDDDAAVREMVGRVLTEEGYQVLSATNGAEALVIADSTRIDLALLDLTMPGLPGWDTFEKLTTKNPLLAVIVITARPGQFFTGLSAGLGGLMEKPLDFPVLLRTVRALLAEDPYVRLERLQGQDTAFYYIPSTGKNCET